MALYWNTTKKKVAKIIGKFALIHSVDTLELAEKISKESEKQNLTTSILLQVNISGESTKHGLKPQEWLQLIPLLDHLPNLKLCGLMTMAPQTPDQALIQTCFSQLRHLKESFQQTLKSPETFHHLSMGMSQDYPLAIKTGATLLRVGSCLFKY